MIGRLRNLPLTFVGAVLLGLLDSYASAYLPDTGRWDRVPPTAASARPSRCSCCSSCSSRCRAPGCSYGRGAAQADRARGRPGSARCATSAVARRRRHRRIAMQLSQADSLKGARMAGLALIALSLVPLVGWAGQLCLCQMSFAAIGAITDRAARRPAAARWALVAGAALAAVVGILVALPVAAAVGHRAGAGDRGLRGHPRPMDLRPADVPHRRRRASASSTRARSA